MNTLHNFFELRNVNSDGAQAEVLISQPLGGNVGLLWIEMQILFSKSFRAEFQIQFIVCKPKGVSTLDGSTGFLAVFSCYF